VSIAIFEWVTLRTLVYSVKDSDVPVDDLDLMMAQLNVEADQHAGDYRADAHDAYRPIIPLMPTRPVALDIDGIKTIHCHFQQALREFQSMDQHS
jgi:hypothetical protein